MTNEIRSVGEAHVAHITTQRDALTRLLDRALANDLDAPLPDDDWQRIRASIEDNKGVFWAKCYLAQDSSVCFAEKVERALSISPHHIDFAVREDVLDLYTRNNGANPALSPELLETIEKQLRHIELPHQMGGLAAPIQNEIDPEQLSDGLVSAPKLVFQIASDVAMGWMWGDVGALYVTVPTTALRFNRFKPVRAWIEGH